MVCVDMPLFICLCIITLGLVVMLLCAIIGVIVIFKSENPPMRHSLVGVGKKAKKNGCSSSDYREYVSQGRVIGGV